MRGLSVQRLVVLLKACASRRGTPGSVSGSNSSAPSLNTSAHERNTWKPSVICVCNVCERMEASRARRPELSDSKHGEQNGIQTGSTPSAALQEEARLLPLFPTK
nr:uncharacterized protein LOC129058782 isoform X3 [Pongo abelii]